MKKFEHMFRKLPKCWVAFDLSYLVVARDAYHGVPTNDLVLMHDRAPSAGAHLAKLIRPVLILKTNRLVVLGIFSLLTII